MKIGYIRVSSKDQHEGRQVKALEDIVDKMYIDKTQVIAKFLKKKRILFTKFG